MPDQPNIPNNTEIDKALKEFEAQSNTGQTQKAPEALKTSPVPQNEVGEIKFDIPSYGAVKYYSETDTPKMVKLVMKWSGGAIKEQKHAEYLLLGFVVVVIGVSIYLFIGGGHTSHKPSAAELEQMKEFQQPFNQ